MLKALIAQLTKSLFRPQYNPDYKTRTYPTFGEPILIQDTLDLDQTVTFEKTSQLEEFWRDDESNDLISSVHDWSEPEEELESFISINPTNGLPMLDDCIDVCGNLFGTNETDIFQTEYTTRYFCRSSIRAQAGPLNWRY
jgi:hypothetical protein